MKARKISFLKIGFKLVRNENLFLENKKYNA